MTTARRLFFHWFSPPVITLFGTFAVFGALGLAGVSPWAEWPISLRWALAMMFLFTAAAHFAEPVRSTLIAMVPPGLPRPGMLITVTGVLEVAGGMGLLIPDLAPIAACCLALLLIAMFPANVYAARADIGRGGRSATPLGIRTVQQVVFVAAAVACMF
jgi:uncharacterized membrane protein